METKIWKYGRGFIKVFVIDYAMKVQISRWEKAKVHCHYWLPKGKKAWDIILPSKLHDRVAVILGLPKRQKNKNRVKAGKTVGKLNLPYSHNKVRRAKMPAMTSNSSKTGKDITPAIKVPNLDFNLN